MFEILVNIALGLALLLLAFVVFMLFVIGIRYLKTLNTEDEEDEIEDDENEGEDICEALYDEIVAIRKLLEKRNGE